MLNHLDEEKGDNLPEAVRPGKK